MQKRRGKRRFNFIKTDKENIYLSKKGLSQIVTTLIIILLALVAIGVVWTVVKNIVQQGSEQIDIGRFTLDLDIQSVKVEQDNVVVVVVRRNPGQGNFVGMNFVFSDERNSETIREDVSLEELEPRTFTFTLTELDASLLKMISVYPIFKLDGQEISGNPSDVFEVKAGTGTGAATTSGPFAELGYTGVGTVEYSISDKGEHINFTKTIVDPLDVLPGDNQTFTVHIKSTYEIVKVDSITELDNSTLFLDFEKTSDDGAGNTIWSASWIVNDTHTIEYRTNVTARDNQGNQNSVTLTWTDSCQSQIIHGQDSVIDTTCTTGIDGVGGIDGGSLTIGTDVTLTIDSGSAFIFNQGKSITITASGAKIVTTSGGFFGNGYLFYKDTDGDGYTPLTTLVFDSSPTKTDHRRAKDTDAAKVGDDCYDLNSNVFPGQTSYFTVKRGDPPLALDSAGNSGNNYDYNCAGGDQKQFTAVSAICASCDTDIPPCSGPSGSTGWTASTSPACGASAEYRDNAGICADQGGFCDLSGCSTLTKTQSCH